MTRDLTIIMSPKFLETCKDNSVISKAIRTIEDNLKDQCVLCHDGTLYRDHGHTHIYSIQSREEMERIKTNEMEEIEEEQQNQG